MRNVILSGNIKFLKKEYSSEEDLAVTFENHYKDIISDNSLWIKLEKQFKTKNFKNSICDGFVVSWDNPTTPTLYITEVELERHDLDKHILPQIGDFISFIQSSTSDDLNAVRNYLYREIKADSEVFKRIQRETKKEVHELLDNSMEDLQILLVIDRVTPELSIGLSQIEKAIRVKIRKIEVSAFRSETNDEIVLFTDSELYEDEQKQDEETGVEEYTLEYHLEGKPENIQNIVKAFIKHTENEPIRVAPMKQYIGFHKNESMIFSCVVRKNSVVFYSKAKYNEIEVKELIARDVKNIGHYTNHLPTEIVLTTPNQLKHLFTYFDQVYQRY